MSLESKCKEELILKGAVLIPFGKTRHYAVIEEKDKTYIYTSNPETGWYDIHGVATHHGVASIYEPKPDPNAEPAD